MLEREDRAYQVMVVKKWPSSNIIFFFNGSVILILNKSTSLLYLPKKSDVYIHLV
jgi:hypothetical protein